MVTDLQSPKDLAMIARQLVALALAAMAVAVVASSSEIGKR